MPELKSKFLLLRPVVYQLDKTKIIIDAKSDKISDQYGLIAQEVKTLFPEIVTEK
ncbi:MAG: tail fiber domain-containing protein [Bacteroidales bacterium]|nr:tail fiber domain-containing protein [Bacteroidales bacterium]